MFDKDNVSSDYIGQSIIPFSLKDGSVAINSMTLAKPKWYNVYNCGEKAGSVLVSFNYFESDPRGSFTSNIAPKTSRHYIKIKALGLRNLKSYGPLPVSKAFIKFSINSIRQPGDVNFLNSKGEIITQPKEAGSNPNI